MLFKSDNENDKVQCENENDLEDDYVEVHWEDLGTKQDISSEESEEELDRNKEYFSGKDKEWKWRNNSIKKQVRKQPQNILCQLPLVQPNAKNAKTELKIWNCFIKLIF